MNVTCTHDNIYEVYKILAYVGLGLYISYHLAYVHVGRKHAPILPYSTFR